MLLFAVIGFILAVMNSVLMRMGTVDNDGYNVFALTRNAGGTELRYGRCKAYVYHKFMDLIG